jgi:hypothetical protein
MGDSSSGGKCEVECKVMCHRQRRSFGSVGFKGLKAQEIEKTSTTAAARYRVNQSSLGPNNKALIVQTSHGMINKSYKNESR